WYSGCSLPLRAADARSRDDTMMTAIAEERLMMSTFEDRPTGIGVRGVQTLARMLLDSVSALNGTGPTAELAEAWIAAVDREWPLSFENVCETLGVDPDALRAA